MRHIEGGRIYAPHWESRGQGIRGDWTWGEWGRLIDEGPSEDGLCRRGCGVRWWILDLACWGEHYELPPQLPRAPCPLHSSRGQTDH